MTDAELDSMERDFATFTRELSGIDDATIDLHDRVARLSLLVGQLHSALRAFSDHRGDDSLATVALMEANAAWDDVLLLQRRASPAETGDVLRRLMLAASQGWTAVEILKRARA